MCIWSDFMRWNFGRKKLFKHRLFQFPGQLIISFVSFAGTRLSNPSCHMGPIRHAQINPRFLYPRTPTWRMELSELPHVPDTYRITFRSGFLTVVWIDSDPAIGRQAFQLRNCTARPRWAGRDVHSTRAGRQSCTCTNLALLR